jgi:membrane protein implicated in regulation of membrane protease activity
MLALGVVLVVLAALLLAAEAHLSTGGLIGSGAAIALIGGVIALLASANAGLLAVLVAAVFVGLASVGALAMLRRSLGSVRRLRPRTGVEAMVGHRGVLRGGDADRRVFVDGGLWRAQSSLPAEAHALHDGDQVVVERVKGLTLHVRKAEEWELET